MRGSLFFNVWLNTSILKILRGRANYCVAAQQRSSVAAQQRSSVAAQQRSNVEKTLLPFKFNLKYLSYIVFSLFFLLRKLRQSPLPPSPALRSCAAAQGVVGECVAQRHSFQSFLFFIIIKKWKKRKKKKTSNLNLNLKNKF